VRTIGSEWRNLAEGLLHVEALEAQFRFEWGPRLEEARRKKHEAELWKLRGRGRTALVAASVLAMVLFVVALALLLLYPPAVAFVLVMALAIPAVLVLYGIWGLFHTPSPLPDLSDLSGRWWATISERAPSARRSGPALSARRYGDVGEAAFVSYLARELPEEYVAVSGLLVAWHLDADVIVAGPTGIWVYEVKHWSGQIVCQDGQWRRIKTYHKPGGRLVQEHQVLKPFDKQWIREVNAVKETLRRRLPRCPILHEAVGGGLVFTHGGFSFSADNTCNARVYTPRPCVEDLSNSPEIPGFTMLERLCTIDALLEWSDRLHERQGEPPWETSSSVELAERVHEDAISQAPSYLSGIGEPGSIAISEDVQEASKKAVWHPHPDDPPKG
jgi:Nuclease-related domain